MADETSNEELLKAVKRIKSPLFEFEFQTVGPLKRWRKMWWQDNRLQHT